MVTNLPVRYEPLRDIANVRDEIERFFREGFGLPQESSPPRRVSGPEVDVEETDDS
jgi:hypothetical protein